MPATGTAQAREYAAIIVDANTGKVIHSRKADKQLYPASLTKIMTLYMVFEALDRGNIRLNTRIRVSRRASKQPPSKLYLKAGDTIAVDDAIFALITKSANDVATAVAEHLGRTESEFAVQMTRKAWTLGMKRTRFRNASGLPNRRQKSTARDMSKLAMALLRNHGHYYDYFATKEWRYHGKTYKNHNKLLAAYKGTDGIKTGYIRASGYNLVASVQRNGRRVIGVVFGGKTGRSRDRQMMRILDRAFKRLPPVVVAGVEPPLRKPRFTAPAGGTGGRGVFMEPVANRSGLSSRSVSLNRPAPTIKTTGVPAPPLRNPRRAAYRPGSIMMAAGPIAGPTPPRGSRAAEIPRPILAPAPVPASVAGASPPLNDTWSIQVGAFSRYAPAHKAITSATRRVPSLLMSTRVAILPVEKNQATLYRARMIGLSEAGARQVCKQLRRQEMPCMPVPPNDEAIYILTQTQG